MISGRNPATLITDDPLRPDRIQGVEFSLFTKALSDLLDLYGQLPHSLERYIEAAAGDPRREQTQAARRVVVKRVNYKLAQVHERLTHEQYCTIPSYGTF